MSTKSLQDTISIKAFRSLLRAVVNQGYDLDKVLEDIGLDFNPLLPEHQHITSVPTLLYSKLYRRLLELLQDEAFGMMTPDRSPPGTFRMMCLFIIHCRNLKQAIVRNAEFMDYCDRFHDPAAPKRQTILELPDQQVLVRFHSPGIDTESVAATVHASTLYMMYRFFSWFTGQNLPLKSVHFANNSHKLQQEYEQLFGVSVLLNKPDYGLVLPASALNLPIVQNEESLQEFLRQAPYPLISRQQTGSESSYSNKVKALFGSDAEIASAQKIAEQMNMSVRTLHRHLQRENTSFQILKDEHRKDAALNYIARQELSINAIALLMGFQDSSAFHRSFKKWTGISPGQYRQQLDQGL